MTYQQEKNDQETLILSKGVEQNINDQYFEYIGKTALSVIGNRTGKNYRFSFSGDKQIIDYRDVADMLAVPILHKVDVQ